MKANIIRFKYAGTALVFYSVILLFSCSEYTRDSISIEQARLFKNHSLIYQVDVKLKKTGDIFIEYFAVGGSNKLYTSLSENTDHAVFNLIGLKPETNYQYIVYAKIDGHKIQSDAGQFHSGALPEELPKLTLKKNDYPFDGYILLKTFFDPGALLIIDNDADVVWYHIHDQTTVRAFNFSPDFGILTLTDSSIIEYINLSGAIQRRVNTKQMGVERLHHDILMDSAGLTYGLTYTQKIVDHASRGCLKNDTIKGDGIVAFSLEGDKIWEWNIFDHADPLEDDSINYLKDDWSHANTINLDVDGNLVISFRNLNQIWKINRETGSVIWKAGINSDFISPHEELDFIHQHDVHINHNGHLMMFDNGINDRGFSRILSIKLDESTKQWQPILNIKLDKNHHTFRMGSARYIDDKHILISSPKRHMQVSIIDEGGQIVWNTVSDKSSFRAIYISPEILTHQKWF